MPFMNGLDGLELERRVLHSPSVTTSHNEAQIANTQNHPAGTLMIRQNHNDIEIELDRDFAVIDRKESPHRLVGALCQGKATI